MSGDGRAECYNWGRQQSARRCSLKIKVLLFASYRERVGEAELSIRLPEGSSVGSLALELGERFSKLTSDPSSLVVAVNREYTDHLHVLKDGDEVALIPPVSGGEVPQG